MPFKLNQNIIQSMQAIRCNLNQLMFSTYNIPYTSMYGTTYSLSADYFCWIHNNIISDYDILSFILTSLEDIDSFNFNTLFCIFRSTLEKYADILNLYTKRDKYYPYLEYLNHSSNYQLLTYSKNSSKSELENTKTMCDKLKEQVLNNFKHSINKCNRKTRYYLLSDFNTIDAIQNIPYLLNILNFNKTLSMLDSKYSQILHNNIQTNLENNHQKSMELLTYSTYIMSTCICLFKNYYISVPLSFPQIDFIYSELCKLFNMLDNNTIVSYNSYYQY